MFLILFSLVVELLFLHFSYSTATSVASLTWNSDTSYPFAISNTVALTGQDHCIYVFGGQNSNSDAVSSSYKFNTTAGIPREWVSVKSMIIPVYGATGCVANDGRFFIFGGIQSEGTTPNFIQIYNPTDNTWNTTTPNMPSGASIDDHGMSCAVDNSTELMYITGGEINGTRFLSYNTSSNTITNLAFYSSPFNLRNQGSFVANNGKLYVFGGFEDTEGSVITYIYDIANNSWSIGANMTQAAYRFGYATDGNRFYAIGGYYINGGYLNYTQVYDISRGFWSINEGEVYSQGIDKNAAIFLDGSLHSIGGFDSSTDHLSIHQVASLCGVYISSGPCDDLNQCIFNGICQNNGTCIGTYSDYNCNSNTPSSSSSTSSSITSYPPIFSFIFSNIIATVMIGLLC